MDKPEQAIQKQTFAFEAEVTQLLHIMAQRLYSNKSVFLRELISNASDAIERLRFESLTHNELLGDDPHFRITVDYDPDNKKLTIADNGIGMTQKEVIENIGTIAKSGTQAFLKSLSADQQKNSDLIGQFGVGFYSAFIVAERVSLTTRPADGSQEEGIRFESSGEGTYTIETIHKPSRGTEVVLHLKKDEETAFLFDDWQLRQIIQQYSDHIRVPILMKKVAPSEKEKEAHTHPIEWETVNQTEALWTRPKNEISEEQYQSFYKNTFQDTENSLVFSHNKVEGKHEYISLLYIPSHAPFDLWHSQKSRGLKLYIKRIFILDEIDSFLPHYLRFMRGVIDVNDLPLNISRELLQENHLTEVIRSALTQRILTMLGDLAQQDPEKYSTFWKNFGKVLKEGPAEDFTHREAIASLLRFSSTYTNSDIQDVSLEAYLNRMKPGQDKIYYITADSFNAAKNSPHLEIFRKKHIEVLLLSDRIDEWLIAHLNEFQGKAFQSVAKGVLDLNQISGEKTTASDEPASEPSAPDYAELLNHVQEVLKNEIKEARLTSRLTDSPACLVADNQDINLNMQRILKSIGREVPPAKPIFEINPTHPIICRLKEETDEARLADWIRILFDQAIIAEGGQVEDPGTFVAKLNALWVELTR